MAATKAKLEYVVRAKASLRADLRTQSWVDKVRAMERMREAKEKWGAPVWEDARRFESSRLSKEVA